VSMNWRTRKNEKRGAIDLSSSAVVMGILNVTPDSFSDGGEFSTLELAMIRAQKMRDEGAHIIDVGGESTRPGAVAVSVDEELARVLPVILALRSLVEFDDIYISVDTSKSAVAREAIKAGADIVNDVSGFTADQQMAVVCAAEGVGVVVMHMQGTPETMQDDPSYEDVVDELGRFFAERLKTLTDAGIAKECIIFDPGIGFGKTDAHSLELLANIGELSVSGRPVLLGVSRKSIFGRLLEIENPIERDAATIAMTTLARRNGCMLHRVHNVKGNHDALKMTERLIAVTTR
jgi:dihydropteroate synthase